MDPTGRRGQAGVTAPAALLADTPTGVARPIRRDLALDLHPVAERLLREKLSRRRYLALTFGPERSAVDEKGAAATACDAVRADALAARTSRRLALAAWNPALAAMARSRNSLDTAINGPPPPDGVAAGALHLQPAIHALAALRAGPSLGLNAMKTNAQSKPPPPYSSYDSTYGTAAEQLDDAVLLGAKYVRQPGWPDLFWGQLGDGAKVPVTRSEITDRINGTFLSTTTPKDVLLAGLLTACSTHGIGPIFTLLTLGGGESPYGGGTHADPDKRMQGAVELRWHDDHLGNIDPAGNAFNYTGTGGLPESDWKDGNLNTFDPRNQYKLTYLGFIATDVAQLLVNAATIAGVSLSSAVGGIEIFNEIDNRNWMRLSSGTGFDPIDQADLWARAYVVAVRAMRGVFSGYPQHADVRFRMPGISSYSKPGVDPNDKESFQYRWYFVLAFLRTVAAELVGGETIGDFIAGVDYHWYHDASWQAVRGAEALITELSSLRALLDGAGLGGADLTVFESGVSCDSTVSYVPTGAISERFQAEEVWRRLAAAQAGGADIAGWHPWSTNYWTSQITDNEMGLRITPAAPSGTSSAAYLFQHAAWHAYAALAAWTDGFHIVSHSSFSSSGAHVFEYRLKSADPSVHLPHRYLVVLDPNPGAPASLYWESESGRYLNGVNLPTPMPGGRFDLGGLTELPFATSDELDAVVWRAASDGSVCLDFVERAAWFVASTGALRWHE